MCLKELLGEAATINEIFYRQQVQQEMVISNSFSSKSNQFADFSNLTVSSILQA